MSDTSKRYTQIGATSIFTRRRLGYFVRLTIKFPLVPTNRASLMNNTGNGNDLPKLMFGIAFLTLLFVASLSIIRPFVLSFSWASMVVIATWPLLLRLQRFFVGRRTPAVILMILLLLLLFVIPIGLIINSVLDNSGPMIAWLNNPINWRLPDLLWLKEIPSIGEWLYHTWSNLIADGGSVLLTKTQPYFGQASNWLVTQTTSISLFILQCVLMLLFSAVLYSHGDQVAAGVRRFAFRLAHQRGDAAVILAAQAIQAVALGVVVTAFAQSILGGIGLAVADIPYAVILTILMFVCCLIQLGPLLILIPAVIWLYWSGDNMSATVLLVWSVVVGTMDAVLRPILIRMGADLPLLLILSGVIGGLLAFGMIGLFIGPVILAVSYRLLSAWMNETPA